MTAKDKPLPDKCRYADGLFSALLGDSCWFSLVDFGLLFGFLEKI
ncbi:hypothetical protein [Moraxella lacunata]